MTTEGSGSSAGEQEVSQVPSNEEEQTIIFRDTRTGNPVDPKTVARFKNPQTGHFERFNPPRLTEAETEQAVEQIQLGLDQNLIRYPRLANHMVNNPDDIWLLPEITLMFDATPDRIAASMATEATEDLATTTQQVEQFEEFRQNDATQQFFWQDVGSLYDPAIRVKLTHFLSALDERGANRVGALALAWHDSHDMDDEENREQLLTNIYGWAYQESQSNMDKQAEGFWGGLFTTLDAGQEAIERSVSNSFDRFSAVLGSPEGAARRADLTIGQKVAHAVGLKPPEQAGDFGWWRVVSGAVDGQAEIGLDPLNLLAGLGAGVSAVRSVPMAIKATKAGRAAMAARSLLPKFFAGATRHVRGGRWARLTYAFNSRTVDELLEGTVRNGVADEALRLIKADNQAGLARTFPQWAHMSDETYRIVQEAVESPEEFVDVLKASAIDEVLRSGRELDDLDQAARGAWEAALRYTDDAGESVGDLSRTQMDELLVNENIPREVRLNAAKNQLSLDAHNMKPTVPFILSDIPKKPKKIFSWNKAFGKIKGAGRGAEGTRRFIARVSPGRPPDEIELFNTRKGTAQLDLLLRHFGIRESRIDELLTEFRQLDLGARQDWFWDTAIREIGRESGVPAFEHNLIQFYKGAGPSRYSGAGTDIYHTANGTPKRMPILSNQMTTKMPLPLEEMSTIFKRAKSIRNRSKIAKALKWNGRGLGATNDRRVELIERLKLQLGDDAAEMADEDLWELAYQSVSPHTGLDGRGWWAGWMMPKAGSAFNTLHRGFTKMMLVMRPFQWALRVAVLEEPIRAHLANMPSMYTNPLQWGQGALDAYRIQRLATWAQKNSDFGRDVYRSLTLNADRDELIRRLHNNGLVDEIFGAENLDDLTLGEIRGGISTFIDDALYDRTRINKLNPIKRVGRAARSRTKKIERAQKSLKRYGLVDDFSFDEGADISNRVIRGYLGEAVGASDPARLYQWDSTLTQTEAFLHGQVWGTNLIRFVEDPLARKAMLYRAGQLSGDEIDVAKAVLESPQWDLLRHDMRLRFPDVEDELELARRYVDDVLVPEVDHLFRPFIDELDGEEAADVITGFVRTRRIETRMRDADIKWDLRGANYAGGVRSVGDWTAAVRGSDVAVPTNLPATSLDPRFMAHDEPGMINKFADQMLTIFGEEATQALNRRPAWLREYKRWFDNYSKLQVPEETARRLATDHANRMVNYVFFQTDQAPHYAAKLNQYFPFAGATYEVLSTWTYKLPVAVGGTWPAGVGEFARKFDRLMDAFVNIGLITREENQDGTVTHVLNLVPGDNDLASPNEAGRFLGGAGFRILNNFEEVVQTVISVASKVAPFLPNTEAGDIRDGGYRFAVGNPLNPSDYGMLSFAQANLGLNPQSNLGLSLLGRFTGAGRPERINIREGETLADAADRMGVSVHELARMNRGLFIESDDFGPTFYAGILTDQVDPSQVTLPEGEVLEVPDTSLWSQLIVPTFMPFGETDSLPEFALDFIPGVWSWGLAGIALQNQPSDEFWQSNELGGFGGMLPAVNQAQVSAAQAEAFMYVESHDIQNGMGPFERIQQKTERLESLRRAGRNEEADALAEEIEEDEREFFTEVKEVAAESLFMRGVTGFFLPTSPGALRSDAETIRNYWGTREYSDNIRAGSGNLDRIPNLRSIEDIDAYWDQVGAWLFDPSGDAARAEFAQQNPHLQAYLAPKTFYRGGIPPEITAYDDYVAQLESGDREPLPLHVTMWRARSSAIQADHYNEYVTRFGSDPNQAAANALNQSDEWSELNERRNQAYQALRMWDDMNGGFYESWSTEHYEPDSWALDRTQEELDTIVDNLELVLELEDEFDLAIDVQGVDGLPQALRGAIAEINAGIRAYEEFAENTGTRNPYEEAVHRYFKEIYIPHQERMSALYDQLPEADDSEQQSLIYEQISQERNRVAGSVDFLNGDTTTPFPNPLEYAWNRKTPEEQETKLTQWVTRPIEWMDLDQAMHITERAPHMVEYLPMTDAEVAIYEETTLARIEVDERWERGEITTSERREKYENIDRQLREFLENNGRASEVEWTDMTPFERLELAGLLPPAVASMTIDGNSLSSTVRYFQESLEAADETPGTERGRLMVLPLFNIIEAEYESNPQFREEFRQLGLDVRDEDTLDKIFAYLFFGHSQER